MATVDVPGRQQRERGVAGLRGDEVVEVGQLVEQVSVAQLHPLPSTMASAKGALPLTRCKVEPGFVLQLIDDSNLANMWLALGDMILADGSNLVRLALANG